MTQPIPSRSMLVQRAEQRFAGEEPDRRRHGPQIVDAEQAGGVLDD